MKELQQIKYYLIYLVQGCVSHVSLVQYQNYFNIVMHGDILNRAICILSCGDLSK